MTDPQNFDKTQKFEFKTPFFSGAWSGKRSAEMITFVVLVVTAVLAYAYWRHDEETKKMSESFVSAMRLVARSIDDNAVAQREFSCLIAKEQDARKSAFSTGECRRQAEIGRRIFTGE